VTTIDLQNGLEDAVTVLREHQEAQRPRIKATPPGCSPPPTVTPDMLKTARAIAAVSECLREKRALPPEPPKESVPAKGWKPTPLHDLRKPKPKATFLEVIPGDIPREDVEPMCEELWFRALAYRDAKGMK
jgi:hypothetical protein